MTTQSHTTRVATPFSRRSLLGASLAGATLAATGGVALRAQGASAFALGNQIETLPFTSWHTWILASADALRPEAPSEPSADELAELVDVQANRDDATIALIQQWNSRPAVLVWTELANAAFEEFEVSPGRQSRAHGMLQTAMHDAVIAAYDAQDAYNSPAPAAIDSSVMPFEGIVSDRPSFPSAEASVAGAAAAVLTGLLPDADPTRFSALAEEAALTRLQAGLNLRRDIEAGLTIGQTIGDLAIAHGADDPAGSDWDGSGRLEGAGYWQPTPPYFDDPPAEPLAGMWKLWVMTSPDQFRPAPPATSDSAAWHSQLAAVQEAVGNRTFSQAQRANYWQNTAASIHWNQFAAELIVRDGLDLPHAARVLAMLAVAQADAQVACWEAKYTYWTERPITADPELDVLFPTPPFPSYPSGHATVSNAAAVALASLFPDDAADLLDLAEEAAASRCWAGIHFPIDDDAGTLLGRNIGYLVVNVARGDGAG